MSGARGVTSSRLSGAMAVDPEHQIICGRVIHHFGNRQPSERTRLLLSISVKKLLQFSSRTHTFIKDLTGQKATFIKDLTDMLRFVHIIRDSETKSKGSEHPRKPELAWYKPVWYKQARKKKEFGRLYICMYTQSIARTN